MVASAKHVVLVPHGLPPRRRAAHMCRRGADIGDHRGSDRPRPRGDVEVYTHATRVAPRGPKPEPRKAGTQLTRLSSPGATVTA